MLKNFSSVKDENKIFTLSNFGEYTDKASSVKILDCLESSAAFTDSGLNLPSTPKKVFFDGADVYVFCTDKRLYRIDGLSVVKVSRIDFDDVKKVFSFCVGKIKKLCILDDEKLYFIGDSIDVITSPECSDAFYHDGRIFFVGDNIVRYNPVVAGTYGIMRYNGKGYFSVNKKFGKIVYAHPYADGVSVLTEKAVFNVFVGFDDDDIEIKKVAAVNREIVPRTAMRVLGKVYFVSNGNLCVLDGDSVKTITTTLLTGATDFNVVECQDRYAVEFNKDGKRLCYFYSPESGEEIAIAGGEKYFGNYAIADDKILSLTDENADKCFWQSKSLDLGTRKEKVLTKIEVKTNAPVKVGVEGRGLTAQFTANDRVFSLITGMRANDFTVKIQGAGEKFTVEEIKFYFKD